jgi:hypothetical protein
MPTTRRTHARPAGHAPHLAAGLSSLRALLVLVVVGCEAVPHTPSSPSDQSALSQIVAAASNHALGFMQHYVHIPDHPDLDVRNTWTLEAWVYPRSAGNGVDEDLVSKWAGVTDAAYILQIDGATGKLRLATNNGITQSIVLSSAAIRNNAWQHVAATFNNRTVKLYLNGVLDRTVLGVRTPINSSQPLAFGREGNFAGGTLNGRLDEVRVWNRVRTPSQIANWRRRQLTGIEVGLMGYWPFNEGHGQIATDLTGHGHNGRLGVSTEIDAWDPRWTLVGAPLQ